jgi:hypothetical protein
MTNLSALQALSIGPAVDVASCTAGTVHSVFARALNIELRGELWTLLSAERGDVPFGIRVAAHGFDRLGLRSGDRVHVRAGFVGIGTQPMRMVIDCRAAPRWLPVDAPGSLPGIAERLCMVHDAAVAHAFSGSARMAQEVMRGLADPGVLARVVGNGPGATPAGDDVVVGILAVLRSPAAGPRGALAGRALCDAMLPLLRNTTDISAHLLRQAARGQFSRALQELLAAIIGDPERLEQSVQRMMETGASSGADMCMGVLACAPAFLITHCERAAA